jgi:hypothetical protein
MEQTTQSKFPGSTPSLRQHGTTNSPSTRDHLMWWQAVIQQDNNMVILLMLASSTKKHCETLKYMSIPSICQDA